MHRSMQVDWTRSYSERRSGWVGRDCAGAIASMWLYKLERLFVKVW